MKNYIFIFTVAAFLLTGCHQKTKESTSQTNMDDIMQKANEFASFRLTTDLSVLTEKEKQMLPLFISGS